jgi:flagellar biosynthesis regulator FlbT
LQSSLQSGKNTAFPPSTPTIVSTGSGIKKTTATLRPRLRMLFGIFEDQSVEPLLLLLVKQAVAQKLILKALAIAAPLIQV